MFSWRQNLYTGNLNRTVLYSICYVDGLDNFGVFLRFIAKYISESTGIALNVNINQA
jgi:hypothetical protein